MNALDPKLVDHAMRLAEEEWDSARPAVQAPVVVRAGERAWFVVQTRVNGEQAVQEALEELGCDTFIPTLRKEIWNKQKKTRTVRDFPLFNRYLFAELPAQLDRWAAIRAVDEIERVLGGTGGLPIPTGEVERFRAAQADGAFDQAKQAIEARSRNLRLAKSRGRRADALVRFPVGSSIRALRGPFGGFSGHVAGVTGRGVVKAMVKLFGGLTPVEFFPDDIATVGSQQPAG